MIDFAQAPAYLQFAENILGVKFEPKSACWLTALSESGTVLGVAIFSRFTQGNCEITLAARDPKFLTKTFILACCFYVFAQLECRRVTAIIAVDNKRSLRLAKWLGFVEEGRLFDWFPESDAIILGLRKQNCTWLKD